MAQLLPNGRQQFLDANGNPLVGGLVYFYIPSTTTPKDTWQDPAQTILNTNPVVCDARGQATIFGAGDYRQILKDAASNTIWDKTVSSFDSSSDVQAGRSTYALDTSATANVIAAALTPSLTTLIDGMVIRVLIKTANTGATTLNINGLGASPVIGLGGLALQGGELPANGRAFFMWSSAANSWILLCCENGALQVTASTKSAHAVAQSQVFGVAQVRMDVTASRAFGTVYTNNTGKPILVWVSGQGVATAFLRGSISSTPVMTSTSGGAPNNLVGLSFVVFNGESYSVSQSSISTVSWLEYR